MRPRLASDTCGARSDQAMMPMELAVGIDHQQAMDAMLTEERPDLLQ